MCARVLYVFNVFKQLSDKSQISLLENQLSCHVQTLARSVCGTPFIDMDSQYVSHTAVKSRKSGLLLSSLCPRSLLKPHPVRLSQVTEISMGEFLMHSSVVWLNPHPSLGRMRKEPEMTVFGESTHSPCHYCCCILGKFVPEISLPTPLTLPDPTQYVDRYSCSHIVLSQTTK